MAQTKVTRTAPGYMSELIPYGTELVPRGYAYQLLLNLAVAQGHTRLRARVLAERWMQGYDLRRQLQQCT